MAEEELTLVTHFLPIFYSAALHKVEVKSEKELSQNWFSSSSCLSDQKPKCAWNPLKVKNIPSEGKIENGEERKIIKGDKKALGSFEKKRALVSYPIVLKVSYPTVLKEISNSVL